MKSVLLDVGLRGKDEVRERTQLLTLDREHDKIPRSAWLGTHLHYCAVETTEDFVAWTTDRWTLTVAKGGVFTRPIWKSHEPGYETVRIRSRRPRETWELCTLCCEMGMQATQQGACWST